MLQDRRTKTNAVLQIRASQLFTVPHHAEQLKRRAVFLLRSAVRTETARTFTSSRMGIGCLIGALRAGAGAAALFGFFFSGSWPSSASSPSGAGVFGLRLARGFFGSSPRLARDSTGRRDAASLSPPAARYGSRALLSGPQESGTFDLGNPAFLPRNRRRLSKDRRGMPKVRAKRSALNRLRGVVATKTV